MIFPEIGLQLSDALAILGRSMSSIFPAVSGLPQGILTASLVVLALGVVIALFWAVGILLWLRRKPSDNGKQPHLSVIVAGRNEEQYVVRCLRALTNLDYPAEKLDIVFVDDHSTDNTRELAEAIAAEHPALLRVIGAPACPPEIGPKKNALAAGIAAARGEILMFTDADCVVRPGWARALAAAYDDRTGAVTGPVLPPPGYGTRGFFVRLERILISYASASAIGWRHPASASGGNFSYMRAAFDQLGGIAHAKTASGDDDLMAQAIARGGWDVRYVSGAEAVVEHLRLPNMRQEMNSTIRHQSTTRYYPAGWRIIYAATIAINLLLFAAGLAVWFFPSLLSLFYCGVIVRTIIEGGAARILCHAFGIRLSLIEILVTELVLPVYLLARAILSLFPTFSWHMRTHRTGTAPSTPSA
jgi:glycosyltransferase involved in cell wall biosynthesis